MNNQHTNHKDYLPIEECRQKLTAWGDVVDVVMSLSSAISDLHSKNASLALCIRPSIIFIEPKTNQVLLDLLKVYKKESISLEKPVSLRSYGLWSAPEIRYRRYVSICEATDIYSIGAVFFWLLMNRPPTALDSVFGGKWSSQKAVFLRQRLSFESEVLLQRILQRCLKNAIKSRFQNANELLSEIWNLKKLIDNANAEA